MNSREIFERAGCREDFEYYDLWHHDDLPFELYEYKGNLKIKMNMEYTLDEDRIPLTEENLQKLIKAFNPK